MKWICAIERDAETQGEISFKKSSIEADKMGPILVKDARFDSLEKTWPFEQLETKGSIGIIVGRKQGEPAHGVAWNHSGQEIEVIFDDARVNCLRSHINHFGARL